MKSIQSFKRKIASVFRCWENKEYAAALKIVDEMLEEWPGNARLHVLEARLIQLQEETDYTLVDAKESLLQAISLEEDYPIGYLELGHFLDAVEDDPDRAAKEFSDGVRIARKLLIDGLLGQARALIQLDRREPALNCLMEALYLAKTDRESARNKSEDTVPNQTLELLQELLAKPSA